MPAACPAAAAARIDIAGFGGRAQLGQMLGEQAPVHDCVGSAGRDPEIVFEHHPVTGAVAYQIGAADMRAHRVAAQPPGRPESGSPVERLHLEHAVGDNRLLGVDVSQECVERSRALPQPDRQACPLVGAHYTRHQVDRKQLGPALTCNPEGDVVGALLLFNTGFARAQGRHAQIGNGLKNLLVPRPRAAGRIDRFIEADRRLILGVILAARLIAEQQRRVRTDGDGGVRPAACRLGDQLVDDIGEPAPAAQRPALTRR